MWSTRSVNNITVNGKGQGRRTSKAQGEIVSFKTTPSIDIVVGEAGQAYEPELKRFTRSIIFVKPEVVIVYDRLEAREPATYEYWLHAINKFEIRNECEITVRNDDVVCDICFLRPLDLTLRQTNEYDPNPRPRITLREWHLTAKTTEKRRQTEFVTVYWPHKAGDKVQKRAILKTIRGGYVLNIELFDKKLIALLPKNDAVTVKADGLETKGTIKCRLEKSGGQAQIIGFDE
jgi:hypothetical protein